MPSTRGSLYKWTWAYTHDILGFVFVRTPAKYQNTSSELQIDFLPYYRQPSSDTRANEMTAAKISYNSSVLHNKSNMDVKMDGQTHIYTDSHSIK